MLWFREDGCNLQNCDSVYRERGALGGQVWDLVFVCYARLGRTNPLLNLLILGPVLRRGSFGLACIEASWPAHVVAASRCGYYQ